ncbi:MAG TPA: 3-oxo-tetronate 4-phosphate decarboxylase [Alphaproteobacteria bacterium]|nr:3-oxo-tetronate 4-phosphate decarboxylase [Alphaproteobacteria bacterium]
MNEAELRDAIAMHGESLYARRYAHGSSGNISVRMDDGVLITPTNSCLGRIDPARISKVSREGGLVSGDKPSKEAFLHLAVYRERPAAQAIVHLHSTNCVAVSCLHHAAVDDVLPPITAYYVMRIGRLPLLPYFRPGDMALADAVRECAKKNHAMLLANHGPVVAGKSLDDAVYSAEELEETARLFLMLHGREARPLTAAQIAELNAAFPN